MLTTTRPPFVSLSLFKDRNFLTGNVFIFVVGMVLFATLALLPPLMQGLMNYSVVTTGLAVAPRGFGTVCAMFIVGRLGPRIDARVILAAGFALTALSLRLMTGFDLQMDEATFVWTGFVQGFGTGLVWLPLATVTFATLPPALRNEGTALFSLTRNIGSSIGISLVETLLTRSTQTLHAQLAEHVTRFNPQVQLRLQGAAPDAHSLASIDSMVNLQAQMMAYNNDFKLMMVMTLCAIPLILLLRRSGGRRMDAAVLE
jgi:DHA2 family multidrug resistance protein